MHKILSKRKIRAHKMEGTCFRDILGRRGPFYCCVCSEKGIRRNGMLVMKEKYRIYSCLDHNPCESCGKKTGWAEKKCSTCDKE